MKKLYAALVGAGNRGQIYADYSLERGDELSIVAVVEPNALRRKEAGDKYRLPEERRYADLDGFLKDKIKCDFVINATMDEYHYETAKAIMTAGYDMLLEKPIVNNEKQLSDLKNIADERGTRVLVCHVLRYTPFYRSIKEIINSGRIGEIMTMELDEHVALFHFLDSFVRGKWNSEKKCGSGFLLQKSCHDTDLICWLNGNAKPKRVSSFGSRSQFIPENAPEGATEFCYNCPHRETCMYSAIKAHLEKDLMPFQTWAELNKPLDQITKEEKAEYLKTHDYGRCAYNSGGDINDRQVVSVEFDNGSTATFTMVGASHIYGRNIRISGTKGGIYGRFEDGKFTLSTYNNKILDWDEEVVDVNKDVVASEKYGGHGGGDYAIMYDAVRYFGGEGASVSVTTIDDSVNGHRIVYAAEKSNKEKTTVVL
ncbi:MAG: Gfo/Idh/MocA family oxidoreductase [Clostridia bacterium]|nr:Gfo/Idh/MocA family oxidoreductase [Clostridia bacterium]